MTARSLAALLVALLLPATTHADVVTGGTLTWSQVNVYDTRAPADTDRTWLGYTTQFAAGSAATSEGATGSAGLADRGRTVPFVFPRATGGWDPATRSGTVDLAGVLRFRSDAHGFDITVERPRVVLAGSRGQLFASGLGETSGGPKPYDRTQPLFDLDLGSADVATAADGTVTVTGAVPALAVGDRVFGPSYPAGAGPERTPNTFGAFALRLTTTPGEAPPPATDPGTVTTPTTTSGSGGDRKGRARTSPMRRLVLRRPPFSTRRTLKVTVTARGRVIARGTLRGRVLRYRATTGTAKLRKGTFKIRVAGTRLQRTIRLR